MRLLSVDWDYFIPTYPLDPERWFLYDWTMRETPFYREAVWMSRAAGFLMNDQPLCGTSGVEETFWPRFKFAKGAKLYYGDSHLFAATIPERHEVTEVWNFDAHHDLGYKGTREEIVAKDALMCDNWLGLYAHMREAKVRVLYPRWKPDAKKEEGRPVFSGLRKIDDEQPVALPFHAVYVCRSSSWSPSWLDEKFRAFLQACPIRNPVNLEEDYDVLQPRAFSMDELHENVATWRRLRVEFEEKHRKETTTP